MSSWIKLHRSSLSHWLYTEKRPLTRREAWENMLLEVNWESSKVVIRGVLYECNRGESLYSLQTWAKKFGWSFQQLRSFFKLLEKDGMIKVCGLQYTTKVTICNYDIWQGNDDKHNKRTTNEQQTNNKRTTSIKEYKEDKEIKEEDIGGDPVVPLWALDFKNYNAEIKYPFEIVEFCGMWDLWIDYRKEKRLSSYKKIGEQSALLKLSKLSGGNIETAKLIINESISNNWTGLFELRNNGRTTNNQQPSKYRTGI